MLNEFIIGNNIREKRLGLNLTMNYVAKKCNITRATLSAIENGTGNYNVKTLLNIINFLSLDLNFAQPIKTHKRTRATRSNTVLDRKINRFVVMCIEQYALHASISSSEAYKRMTDKGIVKNMEDDYEDLHGMSTMYLNQYIDSLLKGDK